MRRILSVTSPVFLARRQACASPSLGLLAPIALLLAVAAVGCSSRRGPAVEFVEGRITLDGEPIADAIVGFSPAGGSGLAAHGRTDAQGAYRLTTAQGGAPLRGAPVGEYVVTVQKYRNPVADLGPEPDPADPAHAKWQAEFERLSTVPLASLAIVPIGYADAATSGLTASVKPGRNTGDAVSFALTSEFRPAKKRP
jgi:hypothetical protein